MNHVLVAIDFSKFSSTVENVAYTLAAKINASVTLVTIIDRQVDFEPGNTGQVFTDIWEMSQKIATDNLEKIKNNHPGVPTEMISFIGDPKEEIISIADKEKANFIIMGTHGRTGLTGILMGSTAEYVIRHANIPVIVVPYRMDVH